MNDELTDSVREAQRIREAMTQAHRDASGAQDAENITKAVDESRVASADEPYRAPATDVKEPEPQGQLYALRGRVVTPDRIITDGAVVIAGDAIAWVGEATKAQDAGYGKEIVAAQAPTDDRYILPGLIDVHNHGGGGGVFPGAQTHQEAMLAVEEHRRFGTTSLVASLVTASPLVLRERAELLADLCDAGELAGIHFEGPFVAQGHCGAQDPAHIQTPNPALTRELLVVSRGHCVSMTIAPEKPYALGPSGVVQTLIDGGAVPSFGHTDATAPQMRKALREVRESLVHAAHPRCMHATATHLYNGMAAPHHREPGPVYEMLSDAAGGGVICELIGDSVHLHPDTVRTTYELIGRDQITFVTDAVATGSPDGLFMLGTNEFEVKSGEARLTENGALAGGLTHLIDVVRISHQGGLPLVDAVYSASVVPARILGDTTVGALQAGKRADIVITDNELHPLQVYRKGQCVADHR